MLQKLHLRGPLLQVGVDESQECADTGVNTGQARASTSVTPRNNTKEDAGSSVNDRATAVTLAGVLASGSDTSAEHAVSDLGGAVVLAASGTGDDGHIDLAEGGGEAGATLGCGSPSCNGSGGAGGRVRAGGGKDRVLDGGASGNGGCELPDGDVVVDG